MRLVPWSSPSEFVHVFDQLFNGQPHAQSLALNHLQAWSIRAPSSLPPAVASTHALLSLILAQPDPQHLPHHYHHRLALAMALTRFVNSLVDPLQTGLFARSLSHLAGELGLPLSFVQIRHRATHEDLPSHSYLLQSAHLAVDWLYIHYWIPTVEQLLNQTDGPDSKQEEFKGNENLVSFDSKFKQLLSRYKRFRKKNLFDQTEIEYKIVLNQISEQIHQFIQKHSSFGVDCNQPNQHGFADRGDQVHYGIGEVADNDEDEDEVGGGDELVDENEQEDEFAIQVFRRICLAMCESEFLIPRSIRKRSQFLKDELPEQLRALCDPLIVHLTHHPCSPKSGTSFISILTLALLDRIRMTSQNLIQKFEEPEVDDDRKNSKILLDDQRLEKQRSSMKDVKTNLFTCVAWLLCLLEGHWGPTDDSSSHRENLTFEMLKRLLLKPNIYTVQVSESILKKFEKMMRSANWRSRSGSSTKEEDIRTLEKVAKIIEIYHQSKSAGPNRDGKRRKDCLEAVEDNEKTTDDQLEQMKIRWKRLNTIDSSSGLVSLRNENVDLEIEDVNQEGKVSNYQKNLSDVTSLTQSSEFKWNLIDSSDWKRCSIGCLPNDVIPDLYQSI